MKRDTLVALLVFVGGMGWIVAFYFRGLYLTERWYRRELRTAGLRLRAERAVRGRYLAPRDSAPAPGAAPGCLCQGGKTQPYCAYCLSMSAPRDSGKER